MTDLQTIEAINRHLDQEPTDWAARLQLADLYEEAGRLDEARYQRWAVKWKRTPIVWEGRSSKQFPWHWWIKDVHDKNEPAIIGVIARYCDHYKGHLGREEAEESLMTQLAKRGWPDLPEVA